MASSLTSRQKDLIRSLSQHGVAHTEIAGQVGCSLYTVSKYAFKLKTTGERAIFEIESSDGSDYIVSVSNPNGYRCGYLVGCCDSPEEALAVAAKHWGRYSYYKGEGSVVSYGPVLLEDYYAQRAMRLWRQQKSRPARRTDVA